MEQSGKEFVGVSPGDPIGGHVLNHKFIHQKVLFYPLQLLRHLLKGASDVTRRTITPSLISLDDGDTPQHLYRFLGRRLEELEFA